MLVLEPGRASLVGSRAQFLAGCPVMAFLHCDRTLKPLRSTKPVTGSIATLTGGHLQTDAGYSQFGCAMPSKYLLRT